MQENMAGERARPAEPVGIVDGHLVHFGNAFVEPWESVMRQSLRSARARAETAADAFSAR